jgi:hypothetical protein
MPRFPVELKRLGPGMIGRVPMQVLCNSPRSSLAVRLIPARETPKGKCNGAKGK